MACPNIGPGGIGPVGSGKGGVSGSGKGGPGGTGFGGDGEIALALDRSNMISRFKSKELMSTRAAGLPTRQLGPAFRADVDRGQDHFAARRAGNTVRIATAERPHSAEDDRCHDPRDHDHYQEQEEQAD